MVSLLMLAPMAVQAQEVDDLQAYLDSLARVQPAQQSARMPRKAGENIEIPVGLAEVDLSKFNYVNRTKTLSVSTSCKFVNGTISAASGYSGETALVKVQKSATVVFGETCTIDASAASPTSCIAAVGIYNNATVYECGDITAADNGTGVAIYLDAATTTFNYVSGVLTGSINNPNGGTVNGLDKPDDSGSCGDNVTWKYYADKDSLVICGTGAMTDYDNMHMENLPWNKYSKNIKIIDVQSGITRIGNHAFRNTAVEKLMLPKTLTAIGDYAFFWSSNLGEITLHEGLITIGAGAFQSCGKLSELYIPASITSIGSLAFVAVPWTSITVSGDNKVYDSRNNCHALIETATNKLLAGGLNTVIPEDVKVIGEAAFCFSGITSVSIPASVETIESQAFLGSDITHIVCSATTPPNADDYSFGEILDEKTLMVPEASIELYRAVTPWSRFGTIEGYEDPAALEQAVAEIQERLQQLAARIDAEMAKIMYLKTECQMMNASGTDFFMRATDEEFKAQLEDCFAKIAYLEESMEDLLTRYSKLANSSVSSMAEVNNLKDLLTALEQDVQAQEASIVVEMNDVNALKQQYETFEVNFPDEDLAYSITPTDLTQQEDQLIQMGYKSNRGFVMTSAGMMLFEQVEGVTFRLKDNEDNYVVSQNGELSAGTQEEATVWTGRSLGSGNYTFYDNKTGYYLAYTNGVKVNNVLTASKTRHAWTITESELDDLQAFLNLLAEEDEDPEAVTEPDPEAPKDTLVLQLPHICICQPGPMILPRTPYAIRLNSDEDGFVIPRPATGDDPDIDFHPLYIPKGSNVIFDDVTFRELTGGDHIIYVEGTVEITVNVNIYIENWRHLVRVGPTGRVIWRTKGPKASIHNEGELELEDDSEIGDVENTGTITHKGGTITRIVNRKVYHFTGGLTNYIFNYSEVNHTGGTVLTARNYENATYTMTGGVIDNTTENQTDTVFINRGKFYFRGGVLRGWGSRLLYHAKGAYLYIDGGTFDFTHIKDYFIEAHDDFYIRGDYDYQATVPMLLEPKVVVRILYNWIYKFNIVFIDGRPAPRYPLFWADPDVLLLTRDHFGYIDWTLPNHRWRWVVDEEKNTIEPRDEEVEDEDDLQAYLDWLAEHQDDEAQSSEEQPQELDMKDRTIVLTKYYYLPENVYVNFYNVTFQFKAWPTIVDAFGQKQDADYLFSVPPTSTVRWENVVIDLSDASYYNVSLDGKLLDDYHMRRLFYVYGNLFLGSGCHVKGWIDHDVTMTNIYIPGAWINLTAQSHFYLSGGWLEDVVLRLVNNTVFVTQPIVKPVHIWLDATTLVENNRLIGSYGGYRLTVNDLANIVFHYAEGEWDFVIDDDGYIVVEKKKEKGDANGDYVVNEADIALVADQLSGKTLTGRFFRDAADANGDGVIDVRDLVAIWKKINGVTTEVAASADDMLQADIFDIRAGETATISINLHNISQSVTAYQFDLTLPEGITLAPGDVEGTYDVKLANCYESGARRFLLVNPLQQSGTWRIVCYSLDGDAITASDVELLYLTLTADEELLKDVYKVRISNVMLSNTSAAGLDSMQPFEVNVSVLPPIVTMNMSLAKGWNWVTQYVEGDLVEFLTAMGGKAERLMSDTQEMVNDALYGLVGNLTAMNPEQGYRLKVSADVEHSWQGELRVPAEHSVALQPGWNWIGYVPRFDLTLEEALTGLTPSENDRISHLDDFADYSNGQWTGTLTKMEPGQGFQYHHNGSAVTFTYPSQKPVTESAESRSKQVVDAEVSPWQYDAHAYADNMTVIAQLMVDGSQTDSFVIGAFCGDECRGVSKQVGDLLFITIHGSVADAEAIRFEAFNMETGESLAINEVITFEGQRLGYVSNPFLLHADNAITSVNGISRQQQVDQPLYNMKGQRVKIPARHQLYLRNGRKYVAK